MLVSSTLVELFDAALGVFKETYSGTHRAAWQYVNTTWMPHKERFVACYIDEFPTLAAPVPRGWKETTMLSSHISMSTLFTS
ncbi:unnamed protein product [Sphagnum jensenii]|uniref:Mutator family transposase n=1 Tax=Sphagnum jensenii TaxID=128206 RepID=A0ABP0WQY7_9BRYO